MIPTWRERLDWTAERSPDGAAIRKAMQAEIADLRRIIRRAKRDVVDARQRADDWRQAANRYQKELIQLRRKP